ncbi:MAG: TonB-dependent receptor [Flavobacteriaceae bacterium]
MKTLRFVFLGLLLAKALSLGAQQLQDSLSVISLQEVEVQGLRAEDDTPVTFSNVTKENLAGRNLGQDIPILLNFLPGVVTTSDAGAGVGYTGIRVRGSDATRVNVTINGIPYNDAESQGTYWANLPDVASSIQSFQLQRGVGTSTNGSGAFGASLNLQTDWLSPDAYAEIASSAGSFNTQKNTLRFASGLLNNHFVFSGRLSKINSAGYVDRASANMKGYTFQLAYKDEKRLLKGVAFGGHEITYQAWYGLDKETLKSNRTYNPAGEIYSPQGVLTGFYDNQVDNYAQDHFQLHWKELLQNAWTFSLGLNYTYGRGFYEEYNDLWYDQNVSFSGNTNFSYLQLNPTKQGELTIDATENITQKWLDNDYYVVTLGLQRQGNKAKWNLGALYSLYDGDHFGSLIWGQQLGEALPTHRFYESNGLKKEASSFAKLNYELTDLIKAYVDLQLRHVSYKTNGTLNGPRNFAVDEAFTFFNPKLGMTYRVAENKRWYTSYAKAQREPNRTDYENGNPKPETLHDIELGWRQESTRFNWQANIYWMEYKDQLVLTGARDEVGYPIRENVGKSRRLGVEIEAKAKLSQVWLWQPNVALSSNKNINFKFQRDGKIVDLGTTNLSYSPSVIAGNALVYAPSTAFQIGVLSKYVGRQYMGNIDAETSLLEGYFTSDINVVYLFQNLSWAKEVQLSLLLNNIFNATYESNGYFYTYDDDWSVPGQIQTIEGAGFYPQAGIHFLGGIRVLF